MVLKFSLPKEQYSASLFVDYRRPSSPLWCASHRPVVCVLRDKVLRLTFLLPPGTSLSATFFLGNCELQPHLHNIAVCPNLFSSQQSNRTQHVYLHKQRKRKMADEEEISVYDEVEIEDMTYDEALQTYFYPCPCGDRFQIALADLQDEETDIAVCPSCSLMIRVIYEVVGIPSLSFVCVASKTNLCRRGRATQDNLPKPDDPEPEPETSAQVPVAA